MSTRPLECSYCGLDHSSDETCAEAAAGAEVRVYDVSSEPTNPMLPAADGGSVCAYCGAAVERGVICCERMREVLSAVGARLLDAGEP